MKMVSSLFWDIFSSKQIFVIVCVLSMSSCSSSVSVEASDAEFKYGIEGNIKISATIPKCDSITEVGIILKGPGSVDTLKVKTEEFKKSGENTVGCSRKYYCTQVVDKNTKNVFFDSKEYEFSLLCLNIDTEYMYVPYVCVNEKFYYGNEKILKTQDLTPDNAVDMGTGVKWARCNMGAHAPNEVGTYYAWGEINEKQDYTDSNYSYGEDFYCDYDEFRNPIYRPRRLSFIGRNISGTKYDVAHVTLGGTWHIPTKEEFVALFHNPSWCTYYHGTYGVFVYCEKNGNSLFFPFNVYLNFEGESYSFHCWTSNMGSYTSFAPIPKPGEIDDKDDDFALTALFNIGLRGWHIACRHRYEGLPVRAVCY